MIPFYFTNVFSPSFSVFTSSLCPARLPIPSESLALTGSLSSAQPAASPGHDLHILLIIDLFLECMFIIFSNLSHHFYALFLFSCFQDTPFFLKTLKIYLYYICFQQFLYLRVSVFILCVLFLQKLLKTNII